MNDAENRGGRPKKEDIMGTRFEMRLSKVDKMLLDILSERLENLNRRYLEADYKRCIAKRWILNDGFCTYNNYP